MSSGVEDETDPGDPAWYQDDHIELDEQCAAYRELEYRKKMLESSIKELDKLLKAKAEVIQGLMGPHKAVRSCAGYTVAWVPFQRKGYTVSASEGERWALRSPF